MQELCRLAGMDIAGAQEACHGLGTPGMGSFWLEYISYCKTQIFLFFTLNNYIIILTYLQFR